MSRYIQLGFRDIQPEQKEIVIAILAEMGFVGFEENENLLKAFIPEEKFEPDELPLFVTEYRPAFIKTIIPSENWNRQWETNFNPVLIDDFVVVRASFHEPVIPVEHDIIITPKMSFGTGHHATTRMMMRQMKEIDFKGKAVLDFGTGTGILAILAEKLGAAGVIAVDNDDWCIENARENFRNNNAVRIDLKKENSVTRSRGFDIILANITKNIILENFSVISQQLNKNGILLLSGLLAGDEDDILSYTDRNSFIFNRKLQEDNWLCLSFLR